MKIPPSLARALREPLLHFVVIGAVVFAVDHLVVARKDDPRALLISPALQREWRDTFKAARGTEPSADDLRVLRQRWIDNETLYREGLSLRVDQGDPTIRERVIFKTLSLIEANLVLPKINPTELRRWFEGHRDKYDQPARVDFYEAVLIGDASSELAQGFVNALNTGGSSQAQSGLRVFKGRPRSNVVDSFGADFATALDALALNTWAALPSKDGLRVVRVEGRTPPLPARFDEVQSQVLQDWGDETMQGLRTVAVRDLGKKYVVRDDPKGAR